MPVRPRTALLCLTLFFCLSGTALSGQAAPLLRADTLASFVSFAASFAERPVAVDPAVLPNVPVWIHSAGALSREEMAVLLDAVAAAAGLDRAGTGEEMVLKPGPKALGPGYGLAVYRLGPRLGVRRAADLARSLGTPGCRVEEVPAASAVVIADAHDRPGRIVEVLGKVEVLERDLKTAVCRLRTVSPEEAASKLDSFYWNLYARGRVRHAPIVLALPWAQSLLVAASPELLDDAVQLVRRMDQ